MSRLAALATLAVLATALFQLVRKGSTGPALLRRTQVDVTSFLAMLTGK